MVLWYVLLHSSTILSKTSKETFFEIAVICLQILFFKVLINLSATTDFPSLNADYISISLSFNHFLNKLL